MRRKRRAWRDRVPTIDPQRLVFLDESGARPDMTRLGGRSPKGQRLHDAAPRGHWGTTTRPGAIRLGGVIEPACLMYDGPTDAALFLAYVQQRLAPSLRPGDVVVMDNLSSHKVGGIRQAVEASGATILYLPPYSPDLNPIENVWSKVKSRLRSVAARTRETLHDAIGPALRTVTASDIRGCFQACGYATPM